MPREQVRTALRCELLEDRATPATATLAAGTLTVTGTAASERIRVERDGGELLVLEGTHEVGRFASSAVTGITIDAGGGRDVVIIGDGVAQPVNASGGDGDDKLVAGGGAAALAGGAGDDQLTGGLDGTAFDGGAGADDLLRVQESDSVVADPADRVLTETLPVDPATLPPETLQADEVETLLRRAAAASASSDAIIAVVDRNGRILGVRVESGVSPAITGDPAQLVFAIDGAVAKARTGAFFANAGGPLTSRTVQFISQSTITEREVNSDPNVTDPNSTVRGPGFVAPVGIKGHFPPNVPNTPQVDLFEIEHTNRDGTFHPGADRIKGTADDVKLPARFGADFAPGKEIFPPDSYGFESGLLSGAQNRGIATLPGGIPLFETRSVEQGSTRGAAQVIGGIGVFFPGATGYATEENSALSTTYDPSKPDRSLEAEWVAFAAAGGYTSSVGGLPTFPVGELNGVGALPGFGLPSGRIDLVGIQLDIVGPGGTKTGINVIADVGQRVGRGNPDDGANQVVDADENDDGIADDPLFLRGGLPVPDGWLVLPRDGVGITAADVTRIVTQGVAQANDTRAAIRLPLGSRTKMVFAVTDLTGEVVGLFRMPDATVFSIDVAVAKARNVAYYANAAELQPVDRIAGVPVGTAFTNRTFRFVAEPRYPQGVDGTPPAPFSQLNDGGADPLTGRQVGARLPASAYQSVVGYDAFNPGTNFRDPTDILNQNGIVFFPGSAPLYRAQSPGAAPTLAGGFGVSGDGVDQDDVVTASGQVGFEVPGGVPRADGVFVRGVRLPYQKFNRNPEG